MKRQPQTTLYLEIGDKRVHVAIAEAALGHPLPRRAQVHHVNGDKWDNRPSNLVICEDDAYHKLLHVRARVHSAGGDPNTQRICFGCKQLKVFADMVARRTPMAAGRTLLTTQCRSCSIARHNNWHRRNLDRAHASNRQWIALNRPKRVV